MPNALATVTMGVPGIFTFPGHGLVNDLRIKFNDILPSPGGPGGFAAGVWYYVRVANAELGTFQISTTSGGASLEVTDASGTAEYTTLEYLPDTVNDQTFFASPTDWNGGTIHLIPPGGALPTPAPTPGGGGGTFSSFSG